LIVSGTARTAYLPFDHLAAELAAFPLASESALANPLTHLDPAMTPATTRLWRAAERELLGTAPGVSLDDLVALRDATWFAEDGAAASSLQAFLRRVALRHLDYLGAGVGPRRPPALDGPIAGRPAHAQARQSWLWLTFALPDDLLLAMAARDGWVPRPDLLTPAVRDLLGRGFAETHLHVGASLDFRCVWSLLQARLASPGLPMEALAAPGAALHEGLDLPAWLLRCAIARMVLAGFLSSGTDRGLVAYIHGPLLCGRVIKEAGVATFSLVLLAVTDLLSGSLSAGASHAMLQDAYAALTGMRVGATAKDIATAWALDPVGPLLGPGAGSPEQRLVIRACAYLDARERSGGRDTLAAQLFWQTVRVRTILYRYITQRPLTPGLPWFIRFYARLVRARGDVRASLLLEAAALRSGLPEGLSSLEMRTRPDPDMEELLAWVRSADDRSGTGPAEVGFVFHFVKERRGEAAPGVPRVNGGGTTADPSVNAGEYRYGDFFAAQRTAAMTLARLLHRWPRTLHTVRGMDIASDELAVPAWIFRPLVTYVRQAAMSGARWLSGRDGDQPLPLRTTVHVGEDFSHLLTGLRHVDEAVEVLDLREGDRIGHGLALGIDPARWAGRVGRVAMPLEDRALDLAWEWSWWTLRGRGADAGRLAYIVREVARLTDHWFGEALDPFQLEQLGTDLADVGRLRAAGFPDGRPRAARAARGDRETRLLGYLTDREVFRRGRRIIWVDPAGEVDAMERIGSSLRAEIGRRGLAVEINPTSNLLIGDLGDLTGHPLWRLNSPLPDDPGPRLAVTVGSDDPLIFNSMLPMEYQILFDALIIAGLSDSDALRWLDGVRRTGLERRFTTPAVAVNQRWQDLENPAPLDPPPL
jgi:hypothetical protein